MARQLRVQYAGAIYHVTVRSNCKEELFADDADRRYFLSRMARDAENHKARVYLVCLMSNHTHLVIETPDANLGRFMHGVLTGYGVYYNRRHNRHGHVTQGRYGAKVVEGNEYLLKLSRYVHLNPVKSKKVKTIPLPERVKCLRAYRWSTYPSYIGRTAPIKFIDYGPMLSLMDGRKKEKPAMYRKFVESAIAEEDEEFLGEMKRSARSIGNEKFREWVDDCYAELLAGREVQEDISFRCVNRSMAPEKILKAVAKAGGVAEKELLIRRRDSTLRAVASRMLCRHGGLTQREAGRALGLKTGGAISCQLRNLDEMIRSDRRLLKLVEQLDRKLAGKKR